MTKKQLLAINDFAGICKAAGANEADYELNSSDAAWLKAAKCLNKLKLICKVFNGDKKPNLADTDQYKYYPWAWIEEKEDGDDRPFGFRLSFGVCVYGRSRAALGARPYLLDRDYVRHVFETFKQEYEEWYYWENMSLQE